MNPTFDRRDIQRNIGEPAFTRGAAYWRSGQVVSAEFLSPNAVAGVVAGSGGQRYRQAIEIGGPRGAGRRRIDGECTCPVSYNCKHVAAVLLSVASAPLAGGRGVADARETSPESPLPAALRVWLDRMAAAQTEAETPPAKPKRRTSERLFYVFRPNAQNGALIAPMKARLKKGGGISGVAREYRLADSGYRPQALDAFDAAICAKLACYAPPDASRGYAWPAGGELHDFLREVAATGRARAGDVAGVEIRWSAPQALRFDWETTRAGAQRLVARDAENRRIVVLPFPSPVYLDTETGACGPAETGLPDRVAVGLAMAPEIPAAASAEAAGAVTRLAGGSIPAPRTMPVERRPGGPPRGVLSLYGPSRKVERWESWTWPDEGEGAPLRRYPCARLDVAYGGAPKPVRPGVGEDIQAGGKRRVVVIQRDRGAERKLLERLMEIAAGYDGAPPDSGVLGYRAPKAAHKADVAFPPLLDGEAPESPALAFTAEALPALRRDGWTVNVEESWPFRLRDAPAIFRAGIESSQADWFSIALKLEVEDQVIDFAPVVLSLIARLPLDERGEIPDGFDVEAFLSDVTLYPTCADGSLVPIEGKRIAPIVQAFLEAQGLSEFHMAEAGRAAALAEALEGYGVPWRGGKKVRVLGERLRALAAARETPPPAALKGALRPYQRRGYGWLRALWDSGFGGLLADDMGLGKTVQALALLLRRHVEEGAERPSLLIAPTSLLGNWRREAERFAPDLKLLTLHGPDRAERFGQIPDHHLVLTTYPLIHRDHEALFAHEYEFAVLDEAQAVKNPAALASKRIRDIRAAGRLALTGTPMENNLAELWSLFDWLIPGLLGDRRNFTKTFRTPIEKHGDRARQRLLSTRLKPFMLRRTKDEVAKELPPRTEIDETIPLSGGQRGLYEAIRTAMDERVRNAIRARGIDRVRITILDALLKLRQVCCDPRLVKLKAARSVTGSVKRTRLLALLEELRAEDRKVLIFSQFVEMLRLIESDIGERGWDYALLHGKTRRRDEEIDRFQNGKAAIFLVSLKAGGVGLNLTAADTVILYDPWWNPAVERQAMDRAHRIGQNKPVFVHRLIAEGTVEATIRRMQTRKQALADALFKGGGDGSTSLTDDDIDALLAPIE